ncbi:hypothetical protein [uncultured Tateyamaria sp.]|uniref:hypothetical protein n=1 Tax=uncultured Tateyamaria sp. TaxID=455651 RepID=UPI002624D1C0|nr:hypothetical protein [uncultured Tateyamaria sp.]
MLHKILFRSAALVAASATLAHADPSAVLPSDTAMSCTLDQDTFNTDWAKITFPEGSLAARIVGDGPVGPAYDKTSGMVYVFPADGPNFTENLSGDYANENTNCSFFKWSSQMFLWLTSTVTDDLCQAGQACTFPNEQPGDDPSYVFSSEFFYRLDGDSLEVQGAGVTTGLARGSKTDQVNDTVAQAGSDGVLFLTPATQPTADDPAPLVYYSVHTNRPFGYVRAQKLAEPSSTTFEEFPADHTSICQALIYGLVNDYASTSGEQGALNAMFLLSFCLDVVAEDVIKEIIAAFEAAESELGPVIAGAIGGNADDIEKAKTLVAAQSGATIPSLEMAIDYLSMAMELKAAWVPAYALADTSGYLLSQASLPTYTTNADGSMSQTGSTEATVALVGLHVVGSVKGHPEMIWATFEHYNNAPNTAYAYTDAGGAMKVHADTLMADAQAWLFADGSMAGLNQEFGQFVGPKSGSGDAPIITKASGNTGALDTPTNVMRLSPWGSTADASSAATNSEMISNNIQVLNALKGFYSTVGVDAPKDPRLNYILTGSSWGTKGAFPTYSDSPPDLNISGTPAMENATLETFTQTFGTTMNTAGCFSCHAVSKSSETTPGWKFGVSHIFGSITSVGKNQ